MLLKMFLKNIWTQNLISLPTNFSVKNARKLMKIEEQ